MVHTFTHAVVAHSFFHKVIHSWLAVPRHSKYSIITAYMTVYWTVSNWNVSFKKTPLLTTFSIHGSTWYIKMAPPTHGVWTSTFCHYKSKGHSQMLKAWHTTTEGRTHVLFWFCSIQHLICHYFWTRYRM